MSSLFNVLYDGPELLNVYFNQCLFEPGKLKIISSIDENNSIRPYRFNNDPRLTHYNQEHNNDFNYLFIPSTVYKIDKYAFLNCDKLERVYGGKNVTEVSAGAFKNCLSLKYIKFIKNLKTIGDEAFQGCSNIKEITIQKEFEPQMGNLFKNVDLENVNITYI